jgi:hypothetical protein
LEGLTDGLQCELGSDVGLIGAIMEIGRALDALTYVVVLHGDEVVKLLEKHLPKWKIPLGIKAENEYKLTAFDW